MRAIDALTLSEQSAPATPGSGLVVVYAKADGRLYIKDDVGTEIGLGAIYDSNANGYTGKLITPSGSADNGVVIKPPSSSWGVGQDYAEGNAIIVLNDAAGGTLGTPVTPINTLRTITATTNATPVAVTVSANHGLTTGDLVRISGTGITALDGGAAPNYKWWKITVTGLATFTLDGSTAPGSTSAVGYAYTDRSPVQGRIDNMAGFGTGGGIHIAPGLRGPAGTGLISQGLWVQPHADASGIILQNPDDTLWPATPTLSYLLAQDVRGAGPYSVFNIPYSTGLVEMWRRSFIQSAPGDTTTPALRINTITGHVGAAFALYSGSTDQTMSSGTLAMAIGKDGHVLAPDGATGAGALASFGFASDSDTGMYRYIADNIGFMAGGANVGILNASGLVVVGSVLGLSDVTLFRQAADVLALATGDHISLSRAGGTHVADASAAVGDKIAFWGTSDATRFGFGLQANALVAYVPSSSVFSIRQPAASGQASTGTTGIALSPSGVITVAETSAPATPASGFASLYIKSDGRLYYKDDVGTELAVAQFASPAFTGTPTAPTASPNNNSTQIATTAYADANKAGAMGYVNHGATAGTARPTGYAAIQWVGSVQPSNMINGDIWIST